MRIGILGGTFNPIHNGHMQMAELAKSALKLFEVHFMVDHIPPHKAVPDGASAEQRLRMVQLATEGLDGFVANDMELIRGGHSYTADTLEQFKNEHPCTDIFFIIGSDMLRTFLSWREPERILSYCSLVCIRRSGMQGLEDESALEIERRLGSKVILLPPVAELSSTQVRQSVAAAEPICDMVPLRVENYIYENGLYSSPEHKRRLKLLYERLSPKKFDHTVGVMKTAVSLAKRYGADPQKALTAALLHDCAKELPFFELMELTKGEARFSMVLHAKAGAMIARRDFGVCDPEILRAIELHTTGDAGMSTLDKIIYLADMIEPSRNFDGVDKIRAESTLDGAILLALKRTIWYIKRKGGALHPATLRAYKDLGGIDGE
ncbi:MAG: nicotinate-nucleotide adenylyltransferase [Clostridia bacterium]|nr:nicotinate-nucleotide adenylyltransferase [Clostridia bacterium]